MICRSNHAPVTSKAAMSGSPDIRPYGGKRRLDWLGRPCRRGAQLNDQDRQVDFGSCRLTVAPIAGAYHPAASMHQTRCLLLISPTSTPTPLIHDSYQYASEARTLTVL
jgi:hypothetical protein